MERSPMYMDWQNQHSKNGYTTKLIYIFNTIPIQIPLTFTKKIEKSILKFIWKQKRPQIAKVLLSKKSNAGGITIPDQTILQSQSNKNCRYEDQWNRIEDLDINPHSKTHLIFDKGTKNI
jgi:hypothetical protein